MQKRLGHPGLLQIPQILQLQNPALRSASWARSGHNHTCSIATTPANVQIAANVASRLHFQAKPQTRVKGFVRDYPFARELHLPQGLCLNGIIWMANQVSAKIIFRQQRSRRARCLFPASHILLSRFPVKTHNIQDILWDTLCVYITAQEEPASFLRCLRLLICASSHTATGS